VNLLLFQGHERCADRLFGEVRPMDPVSVVRRQHPRLRRAHQLQLQRRRPDKSHQDDLVIVNVCVRLLNFGVDKCVRLFQTKLLSAS